MCPLDPSLTITLVVASIWYFGGLSMDWCWGLFHQILPKTKPLIVSKWTLPKCGSLHLGKYVYSCIKGSTLCSCLYSYEFSKHVNSSSRDLLGNYSSYKTIIRIRITIYEKRLISFVKLNGTCHKVHNNNLNKEVVKPNMPNVIFSNLYWRTTKLTLLLDKPILSLAFWSCKTQNL